MITHLNLVLLASANLLLPFKELNVGTFLVSEFRKELSSSVMVSEYVGLKAKASV